MKAGMDFAAILDEWDRRTPFDKTCAKDENETEADAGNERRRLLNKKPDACLDLHGLTQEEAWDHLDDFFRKNHSQGNKKVLIIHGKGNHSKNEGVLSELCRKYVEQCPFAGASGHNTGSRGGSGATWVLLKKN